MPNLPTARKNILDYSRSQVPASILKAIDLILSPCCNPNLLAGLFLLAYTTPPVVTLSNPTCGWDNVDLYGLTIDITVSDPSFANQTVQILLLSTANEAAGEAGSVANVTLDSTGSWSGIIKTPMEGCPFPGPYVATFAVYIISAVPGVVHTSDPITITVPNCC